MLATRYANPFQVVDAMIESSMLPGFIDQMIESANEDKLWQLYLATALWEDRPFSDWKAAVLDSATGESTAGQEITPEAAVAHAENILAGFKPF